MYNISKVNTIKEREFGFAVDKDFDILGQHYRKEWSVPCTGPNYLTRACPLRLATGIIK